MKAYVLDDIGVYNLKEIDKPASKEGEVLVCVRAAGICGSDIPRAYFTGTYHYPLIPGHEFAGQVVALGDGVEDKWLGKRVGVFPLIPCKECSPCRKKQYEMCQHYNYLGSRTDGGFAEYVTVPEWNLIELPANVSFEQAAMMEPMAVALHSIRKCQVTKEDTVAVCGLGTIGLFVVMFLKQMGCKKVLGLGNKEFQKKSIQKLGVSEEDLARDWDATALWDNEHDWFNRNNSYAALLKTMKQFTGQTLNDRIETYVKSIGFTDEEIARLRNQLLTAGLPKGT